MDSEDEEIQSAIQASLQNETTVEVTGTQTLSEILAEFQKNAVLPDVTSKVIVFRNDILQSALRALDRKALNPNARLYVKFSGEMGEDFGGPRREFFRLAIQELHQSRFFEGPEGAKVFTHDLACVEKKQYMLIGRLVALSMAQDGPGLHFLDGNLYDLMVGVDVRLTNVDMHLPQELTALIEQIGKFQSHFPSCSFSLLELTELRRVASGRRSRLSSTLWSQLFAVASQACRLAHCKCGCQEGRIQSL